MRPIELQLAGFGPFYAQATINFEERSLFAITGPTGAGKTTILDALVFALYARTPRLGRGYDELKHPGAEVAWVQLDFALDQEVFRVTRRIGRRNEHRLERLSPEGWKVLPESEKARTLNKKIEALLGMDFEAFTRAVLLPQGAFDRFLRGEPKERKDLLKHLFGLGRLDAMHRVAQARRAALKEKMERLLGELEALSQDADPEALATELEAARARYGQLSAELETTRRALAELEVLQASFEALARARRRLAGLKERAKTIERLRQRRAMAERVEPLLEALMALRDEERRLGAVERERAVVVEKVQRLEADLRALPEAAPEAVLALGARREALKRRLEERARLEPWKGRLLDIAPLPGEETFDAERAERLLAAQAAWRRLLAAEKRLSREEERLRREGEALKALANAIAGRERALAELKERGVAARAELDALERELETRGLAAYRHLIRPGEPCPLCGQVVVELPPEGEADLSPLKARREALKGTVDELRERYQSERAAIAELRGKLEGGKRALEERRARLDEDRRRLEEERRALLAVGDLEAVQEALGRLRGALDQALAGPDPAEELRALEAEERAWIERRRRRETILNELEALKGRLAALEAQRSELLRHLARERQAVEAGLSALGLDGVEALMAYRLTPEERAAIEGEIEAYEHQRTAVEAELRRLENELSGKVPPSVEEVKAKRRALEGLEAELENLARRLGRLEEALERARTVKARRQELEKARAELGRSLSLWEKLSLDLRSDRFPEYLLRHYQRGLVARASEILKGLYHGRYELLSDGGEYFVRDTWTEGVRSVRTLSGGESFLASLALALALSEQLAAQAPAALFLDEGFGTLDRDALEVVAETLVELPKGGRMVGIVTHVEELAERLPARLVVEKSPAGSRVRWVEGE